MTDYFVPRSAVFRKAPDLERMDVSPFLKLKGLVKYICIPEL